MEQCRGPGRGETPGGRVLTAPVVLPPTTCAALAGTPFVTPVREGAAAVGRVGVAALTALLAVYRRGISPLLGPHCRFHPSCSAYALEALRVHGLVRGTLMTLVRLGKCGPWHPGGLDPVPSRAHRRAGPGTPITEEQAP